MIGHLREMFATPESQDDGYSWAATFGGHAWLGVGLWGLIAIAWDTWNAAWVTPLLYFVLWEGLQFALVKRKTKALAWDGVLDAVAVAFACYSAALLADRELVPAVAAWSATVIVMSVGWRVRK